LARIAEGDDPYDLEGRRSRGELLEIGRMSEKTAVAEHWVTVAKADYLEPGELMYVEVDDEPVCLINLDGEIHAINDTCTHEDTSLSDGTVCGDEIECPMHGGAFNIRTGEPAAFPVVVAVEKYGVRIIDNEIQVSVKA
jgi:nitrite reductase/ring-hydroxylating ferredoxin subunit